MSVSSLRRIRPSRSAHGQISRVSIPSARMLASATRAPATICWERSELTPSNSARSAVVIREMNAISCRSPLAVRVRLTRGPAPEGAAPVRRARDRKVLEVPTRRSAAPAARNSFAGWPVRRRASRAARRHGACPGILLEPVPGEPAGAELQRERDVGILVAAARQLERTTADVEVEDAPGAPPVPAAHREEGQPRLVDAGEHLEVHAGLGAHAGEDDLGVVGVAHGRRREGHQLTAPRRPGDTGEIAHRLDQPVGTERGDVPAVVRVLRKP